MQFLPRAISLIGTVFCLAHMAQADSPSAPPNTSPGTPSPANTPAPQAATTKPASLPAVAFLGLITKPIPEIICEQLNLEQNSGLIVLAVAPNSPAEKIGITANDLVLSANRHPLKTTEDLMNQIIQSKPGDVMVLDMIRKGTPNTIKITLGSRLTNGCTQLGQADRIHQQLIAAGKGTTTVADATANIQTIDMPVCANIRILDPKGTIEVKTKAGANEIIVRDMENRITWSGPWNNEQDKKLAPEEIRKRCQDLNLDHIINHSQIKVQVHTHPSPNTAEEKPR